MHPVIDLRLGQMRGVRLLRRASANGRLYARSVMLAARRMYEGKPIHPVRSHATADRTGAPIGWVKWPRVMDDGLYCTVRLNWRNPRTAAFVRQAARNPDGLGLSHFVEGRVLPEGDPVVVTGIDRVVAVDLVEWSASTGCLFDHIPEIRGNSMARKWLNDDCNTSLFGERRFLAEDEDDDIDEDDLMDDPEPDDPEAANLAEQLAQLIRQVAGKNQPVGHMGIELLKKILSHLQPEPSAVPEGKLFADALRRLGDGEKFTKKTFKALREADERRERRERKGRYWAGMSHDEFLRALRGDR